MVPTQNLGHQKCGSVEKLQADLEVAAKRDERARGRELKRVAGERERQLWEEIESKKQIIDEPGVKVIDISFDFESVVGTKLSNTGFVLHLLRSKYKFSISACVGAVLRNLKSLIEILYCFIEVGFHFPSGFKVNIADTRVFHLVCGTGKYQRALNLRKAKPSIDLCPGLKVK